MSYSQKRKDIIALCAMIIWIVALALLAFMTACDVQSVPFGEGGQDVQIYVDGKTDGSNLIVDTMGPTADGSASDTENVESGNPPQDASKCTLPDPDCSLALNPDPQNICVSPTQGPYTSFFVCGEGKRFCCVPGVKGAVCAFLTCVML